MRERPIRLKAYEVRAILSGVKTQTRLVVKLQPPAGHKFAGFTTYSTHRADEGKAVWATGEERAALIDAHRVACPFGKPGDRLWVRETWQQVHPLQVAAGRYSHEGRAGIPGPPPVSYRTIYRADGEFPPIYMLGGEPWPYRSLTPFERNGMQSFVDDPWWNPSVHMPRWACRLVLEITDVRVERLQAISETDALAEGITRHADGHGFHVEDGRFYAANAVTSFADLWASTGGDWDANPWVWAISFKRIDV